MSTRVLKMKNGSAAKVLYYDKKLTLCAVDRQTIGNTVNIMRHHEKNWIAFTFILTHDNKETTNYILQAKESSLEFVVSKSPLNQLDQVDGNPAAVWFEKVGVGDYYNVKVASHPQQYICIENTPGKQIRRFFISDDENARAKVKDEAI